VNSTGYIVMGNRCTRIRNPTSPTVDPDGITGIIVANNISDNLLPIFGVAPIPADFGPRKENNVQ